MSETLPICSQCGGILGDIHVCPTDSAPPSPQCTCEVTSRTLGYQVVTRIKTACPKHGAKLGVCMCGHYHDGDCRECGCDCWTIPLIPDGQISFEPAPASPAPHDTLRERITKVVESWAGNSTRLLEYRGFIVDDLCEAALAATTNEVPTGLGVSGSGGDEALRELLEKWEGYRAAQLEHIPLSRPEDDRQARTVLSTYGICIVELKRALSSRPPGGAATKGGSNE